MMSLVSDFWQLRCNSICKLPFIDEDLREFNTTFWLSFIESTHKFDITSDTADVRHIEVLSTVQWPLHKNVFYDMQLMPQTTRYVQRLRITAANLRCALAKSKTDKVISNAGVNLLELKLSEVDRLCRKLVNWWDQEDNTFLSPFSPMANIIRNWLRGVYGEGPSSKHPSLQPVLDFNRDNRTVICECANSLLSVLTKNNEFKKAPLVGVIGWGTWADKISSELRSYGAKVFQYDCLHEEHNEDILFLLLPENSITPVVIRHLSCKVLVELIPGQINPECDAQLIERDITVIPDIVCSSSLEIVEDWWLGGSEIPDWPLALYLRLSELWSDVVLRKTERNISFHDAAFLLALERLTKHWNV